LRKNARYTETNDEAKAFKEDSRRGFSLNQKGNKKITPSTENLQQGKPNKS
jgi:hypothetical protein